MTAPKITKIEVQGFSWDIKGLARGRVHYYEAGSVTTSHACAVKVYTDTGPVGEYAGFYADPAGVAATAKRYIGANVFDRELLYQRNKTATGQAAFDVALWDIAGKMADMPIHALIGTCRTEVPAYASTANGALKGPLSSPESYADFAQQCLEMGYQAFKIHPFAWQDVRMHIKAVLAIGERVGGKMDLMLDSYCLYETFADGLKVGRACDEAGYFWYEDPFAEGGITTFNHERLRELIRTPLLEGEQVNTVEQRFDFVLRNATDYARGDIKRQGLTATLKLAHAAEMMGIDIEPHMAGPEELNFMAAVRNANYYEIGWTHPKVPDFNPPIYKNMNVTRLDSIDKRGMVQVPMSPGLGCDYDWAYITKHSTGKVEVST